MKVDAALRPNGQFTVKLDDQTVVTVWTPLDKHGYIDYEVSRRLQQAVVAAIQSEFDNSTLRK